MLLHSSPVLRRLLFGLLLRLDLLLGRRHRGPTFPPLPAPDAPVVHLRRGRLIADHAQIARVLHLSSTVMLHAFRDYSSTPWARRGTAASIHWGFCSIPTARRPSSFAATRVEPAPIMGSSTIPPGLHEYSSRCRINWTGFCVGWTASPWHEGI